MSISNGASSAFRVEACVIGAGVIGLAVARALALAGKEVLILESENTFGSGTSSRNSEVIHAGIYYPNGSLKAQLCIKGKEMLYKYCNERNILCEKKGKIIVPGNPLLIQLFNYNQTPISTVPINSTEESTR